MQSFYKLGIGVALAGVLGLAGSSARADLLFDDSQTADAASHEVPSNPSAPYGVAGTITVAADTPITNFTLLTFSLATGGNLKFIVYDETTGTTPYVSAPVLVPPDTLSGPNAGNFTYKQSPDFSLTLKAGDTYDLGAISDSDTYFAYSYAGDASNSTPVTQNGITGPMRNILIANYNNPGPKLSGSGSVASPGSAQFALQISNTPEPASLGLLGVAGAGLVARRRQH